MENHSRISIANLVSQNNKDGEEAVSVCPNSNDDDNNNNNPARQLPDAIEYQWFVQILDYASSIRNHASFVLNGSMDADRAVVFMDSHIRAMQKMLKRKMNEVNHPKKLRSVKQKICKVFFFRLNAKSSKKQKWHDTVVKTMAAPSCTKSS